MVFTFSDRVSALSMSDGITYIGQLEEVSVPFQNLRLKNYCIVPTLIIAQESNEDGDRKKSVLECLAQTYSKRKELGKLNKDWVSINLEPKVAFYKDILGKRKED